MEGMEKEKNLLTPGKLYAKLSAAFRAREDRRCPACRMPMVFLLEHPRNGAANWSVEAAPAACEPCRELIADIVRTHGERFDLWDPTAIYSRPPLASFIPALGQRPQ
jgi:hypothetical protein